jgi:hypothetical protein
MKLITHLHLVYKERMSAGVAPTNYPSSWRGVQLGAGTTLPFAVLKTLKSTKLMLLLKARNKQFSASLDSVTPA